MRFFRKCCLFAFALWLAFLVVCNPIVQSEYKVKAFQMLSVSQLVAMSKTQLIKNYPNDNLNSIFKYYVVLITYNSQSDYDYSYNVYFGDDEMYVEIGDITNLDKNSRDLRIVNYKADTSIYYSSKLQDYVVNTTFGKTYTSMQSLYDYVGHSKKNYGYYKISDGTIIDTEKPVINYQDYYCVYTYSDGTTTDSSNAIKNHEFGGGATRGGGAGRDVDENGKTKPVITDEDTFGDEDKEPDKKYYRVCYDKDTSTWKPHGTIQIVNNTIINNTYIVTDGTVEPATGSDVSSDDWPEDTPSWIEFLGNLISGLLQGLGDAIGGLGSAIGGIANALGNIISSLITALTDLFKTLFVPSEGFLSDSFTGIKDSFESKFPFLDQADEAENSIIGTIQGADSSAPSYEMELPQILGGGSVQVFDFSFYDQYRDLIHGGILFFSWATFIMRLPHKLSKAIGGVN